MIRHPSYGKNQGKISNKFRDSATSSDTRKNSHEDKLDFGRNQGLTEGKSIEEGLKVMRATKRSLSRHRDTLSIFRHVIPRRDREEGPPMNPLKFNERSSISRIVDPIFR